MARAKGHADRKRIDDASIVAVLLSSGSRSSSSFKQQAAVILGRAGTFQGTTEAMPWECFQHGSDPFD